MDEAELAAPGHRRQTEGEVARRVIDASPELPDRSISVGNRDEDDTVRSTRKLEGTARIRGHDHTLIRHRDAGEAMLPGVANAVGVGVDEHATGDVARLRGRSMRSDQRNSREQDLDWSLHRKLEAHGAGAVLRSPSPTRNEQSGTDHERDGAGDRRDGDCFLLSYRRAERPQIHRLLAPRVGDAAIGEPNHPEDNQDDAKDSHVEPPEIGLASQPTWP